MSKKGTKIKDLAREFGLTARQLLDKCREEGISAQNSITRLRPEIERALRARFSKEKSPAMESNNGVT